MPEEPRTALGSAHERFLRSLPDRGRELRELAGKLQSAPGDERMVEQIGRRLHALYASAQVFQEEALLRAIRASLGGMETARLERRPPTPGELDSTLSLCDWLEGGARAEYDAHRISDDPPAPRAGAAEPGQGESLRGGMHYSGGAGIARALNEIDRASDRLGEPVSVPETVAGTVAAPEVIAVLIVASPEVEREVRAALPEENCELASSADADTALAVIDEVAPDVVLVETALFGAQAGGLVRRLRGARAGGVRAVVALVPESATDVDSVLARTHVDAVLRSPLPRTGLLDRLLRWSGRGPRAPGGIEALQAGTVEEIARGVAEEIRRGIAGSLRHGRAERIELGDKSELLAATWSAVARIRQHLADRADGRVHFDEAPYPGGPAALALTERESADRYLGLADAIAGKRILIADDDPAVVWFFAGLLREAGAVAIEALEGREALEHARRQPPDLVISDILMPEIDGFTLCRELRRDLSLSHVPVILLSWKEDFLQRMRELDAGAAGYLRKEAGTHQILSTVAEALRPRTELAALIRQGGEVRGRVELVGVPVLLRTVAALRPDARVTVHDAWNVFDMDIRDGATLAITRTASDGSFARGEVALRQLLGVESARFTVGIAVGSTRAALPEPLDRLLGEGLRQLGAVLDAVSDNRLMRVCRVALDDEILSSLLTATPTALADVAARLRAGEPARELVLRGAVSARDLEHHLRELARRGAVLGVFGADGEDLVLAARNAREQEPGALLHVGERPRSPLPTMLSEGDVEWMEAPSPPRSAQAAAASTAFAHAPAAVAQRESPRPRATVERDAARESAPVPEPAPTGGASAAAPRAHRNTPPYPIPVPARAIEPRDAIEAQDATASDPRPRRPVVALGPALAAEQAKAAGPFAVRSSLLHEPPHAGAPAQSAPQAAPAAAASVANAPAGASAASETEWLKLAAIIAVLLFVGFAGWRAVQGRAPAPRARATATPSAPAQPPAPPPEPTTPSVVSSSQPESGGASAPSQVEPSAPGFGRVLPFIDRSRGVEVAQDQGLLVVEYEASGPPPRVRIGERDLGAAPIAAALPPGRHELVLKRDARTSFRYVVIRVGETRIVQIRD